MITNARFLNLVVLRDNNDGSELVAGVQDDDPGEKVRHTSLEPYFCGMTFLVPKWRVTLLANKKYTIKNCSFSSFANCAFRPEQQWVIRESR
jgi:hypothetical protein